MVDSSVPADPSDPDSQYLFDLQEDRTYVLSDMQDAFGVSSFAIVCVTDPLPFASDPFTVGSVGFRDNRYGIHQRQAFYDDVADYSVNSAAPFAFEGGGGSGTPYNPTDFLQGTEWSITCEAFVGSNLTGQSSGPVTRNFSVIPNILSTASGASATGSFPTRTGATGTGPTGSGATIGSGATNA